MSVRQKNALSLSKTCGVERHHRGDFITTCILINGDVLQVLRRDIFANLVIIIAFSEIFTLKNGHRERLSYKADGARALFFRLERHV
jgi:hypothetical protein